MDAFWIILTGTLVAVSASLLGVFLILRKMSMIGDAISHAVLPGIVIAFLLTNSSSQIPMIIGASLVGVLATFLIESLHRKSKLQTDASIGIIFTFLFAVGIILVSQYTGQVDLDQECVLYGEIAFVPLDRWVTASGIDLGPRNIWTLGACCLAIIATIIIGYKGLYLTTFDQTFAASLGISTVAWHYTLMTGVSLTTVVSFESVGAILVVAFLIVPASTAYLLTDDLKIMLILAALIGFLSVLSGYYVAVYLDASIAACMALMSGVFFAIAFLFSPGYGIAFKGRRAKMGLQKDYSQQL
ncbi:MAG: metal ABC transporter permease [Chitinophagales bacterium]|nr:metal ABC transporter permease [Chitinophagales bacterium]